MRLLGLDVGDRRIGVATADTEVQMAFPLTVLERTGQLAQDIDRIASLCAEEMADMVVVGMPVLMSGETGEQAEKTQAFAEALRARVNVPLETIDERLTTWEAEAMLREMNYSSKEIKKRVDSAAAAIILNDYLERTATQRDA